MSGRLKKPPVDDLAAARQLVRELHEAMQEARAVLRQMTAAIDAVGGAVDQMIADEVRAGLDRYGATLNEALEKATQMMYRRFDKLADALVSGPRSKVRRGEPSLMEVAEAAELDDATKERVRRVQMEGR